MVEFISNLIGNDIIATIVMSFIPLIELKGGIVFARGVGINTFAALGLGYVGATVAFFPVFFLLIPILKLLKKIKWFNTFALKVEGYFADKAQETMENRQKSNKKQLSENFLKIMGVFIFVAIPLPMTGVWTGTAIAVFLGLKFREAILPVLAGNLVAGLIITGLSELFLWAFGSVKVLDYVLYALFALALILLIVVIVKICNKKVNKTSDLVDNSIEENIVDDNKVE